MDRYKSGGYKAFTSPKTTKDIFSSIYSSVSQMVKDSASRKKISSTEIIKNPRLRASKQSPIIKASRNMDLFYKSIKADCMKEKKLAIPDSIFKERPEILVSYYSKKSSEFGEEEVRRKMSDVCTIEQLQELGQMVSEVNLENETSEYQEAFKALYSNMKSVFGIESFLNASLNKLSSENQSKDE